MPYNQPYNKHILFLILITIVKSM